MHSLPAKDSVLRYPGTVFSPGPPRHPTRLCGCLGYLYALKDGLVAEECWVWRTDARTLRRTEQPLSTKSSPLELACEVAELYHDRHPLYLPELRGDALEVVWLELAADETLLVFLKLSTPSPS